MNKYAVSLVYVNRDGVVNIVLMICKAGSLEEAFGKVVGLTAHANKGCNLAAWKTQEIREDEKEGASQ